jgi:hypothetical protein
MNKKISILTLLLALTIAAGYGQGQTGTITGRVVDARNNPLSEVALSLTGSSIMAQRTYLTKATGLFRFPDLPGGEYQIRADLPGYKSNILTGISVGLGRTTKLAVKLETSASETEEDVQVAASASVIDVRSPKLAVVYTEVLITALPMARDLYDIQNSLPGAIALRADDIRSSSILGGTGRGQRYILDGGLMNDPASSYLPGNLNTDIIGQVEVAMGALPADTQGPAGAVINVVSKRGGSHGGGNATFYFTDKSLVQDLFSAGDIAALGVNPPERYNTSQDLSVNLGGPLWADRAWGYVNLRRLSWARANPYSPEERMARLGFTSSPHYDIDHKETMAFVRISVRPTEQIMYSGMFHYGSIYEPVAASGLGPSVSYENAVSRDTERSYLTSHSFSMTVDQNTTVEAHGTYMYRNVPLLALTQGQTSSYDMATDVWWGAAAYNDVSYTNRLYAEASILRYEDGLLGFDHELKTGAEFEQNEYHDDWYRSNPYVTYWADYAARNPYYYGGNVGRFKVYPGYAQSGQWDIQTAYRRFSFFLQDNLSTGRLALNLGVRFEYSLLELPVQGRSALSYTAWPDLLNPAVPSASFFLAALYDQMHATLTATPFDPVSTNYRKPVEFFSISPRLGAVYDVFGNGRTALKFAYSRYYEPIWASQADLGQIFAPHPMDIAWTDLNLNGLMDLPPEDAFAIVDPGLTQAKNYFPFGDLKAPSTDEFLAGLEHELVPGLKLGFHVLWRKTTNIIGLVDSANGYDMSATDDAGLIWLPFSFTEPGTDGRFGTSDDQKMTVYGLRADRPDPVWQLANIPETARTYRAAIFSFEKEFSHRWQLKGSVVYSSFRGTAASGKFGVDGETPVYDSPNVLTHADGPLYYDRPWQVKIMASYLLPWNISLGAYYQYATGSAWQRTLARVYFPANYMGSGVKSPGYATVNAEPAGTERGPALSNLNLRLEKTFRLGASAKFSFFMDIFNVTGVSGKNLYEDSAGRLSYNLYPDKTQAAFVLDSNYGKVASVYGVRTYLFGARYNF